MRDAFLLTSALFDCCPRAELERVRSALPRPGRKLGLPGCGSREAEARAGAARVPAARRQGEALRVHRSPSNVLPAGRLLVLFWFFVFCSQKLALVKEPLGWVLFRLFPFLTRKPYPFEL